ncbi:MAG: DUF4215 domain-containing protein, partial [Sandaracinaceae bacterium]|nr:DUF4215 domain-containing protein [Sandaracinaceae bacterium]
CDDGNTASGDGCSASCRTEVSACGDGALGPGESCDDGNTADGDGCSARCAHEVPPAGSPRELTGSIAATDPSFTRTLPSCSGLAAGSFYYDVFALENTSVAERVVTIDARWSIDGFLALYAWPFDRSAPEARCLTANDDFGGSGASRLADVVIAPGERVALVATTYAASTAAGSYTITLTTAASCGNGLLTGSEQCDDGGLAIGDGCDASCFFEPNRFCRGEPSTCVAVACGNGATELGEGCDDANTAAGDGCSTRCASEIATGGGSIVLSGSLDAACSRCRSPRRCTRTTSMSWRTARGRPRA